MKTYTGEEAYWSGREALWVKESDAAILKAEVLAERANWRKACERADRAYQENKQLIIGLKETLDAMDLTDYPARQIAINVLGNRAGRSLQAEAARDSPDTEKKLAEALVAFDAIMHIHETEEDSGVAAIAMYKIAKEALGDIRMEKP